MDIEKSKKLKIEPKKFSNIKTCAYYQSLSCKQTSLTHKQKKTKSTMLYHFCEICYHLFSQTNAHEAANCSVFKFLDVEFNDFPIQINIQKPLVTRESNTPKSPNDIQGPNFSKDQTSSLGPSCAIGSNDIKEQNSVQGPSGTRGSNIMEDKNDTKGQKSDQVTKTTKDINSDRESGSSEPNGATKSIVSKTPNSSKSSLQTHLRPNFFGSKQYVPKKSEYLDWKTFEFFAT